MEDMSCLAEGYVVPVDFDKTGINLNEMIVGATGCGKSFSNAYSRLLHTSNSSVVIPIAKKAIKEKFSDMFRERGYEVIDIDLAHPGQSEYGYDPFDYIHSDEDVIQTAKNLVQGSNDNKSNNTKKDPYWDDSAASIIGAEIALVRLNAMHAGKKPCFADVIALHHSLKVDMTQKTISTNLDSMFEEAEKLYPDNQAYSLWNTIAGLAVTTASCILSAVNNAYDKIFSVSIIELMRKDKKVDFKSLGERKTALFITTSPMNKTLLNFNNIIYADMFRELFESAENQTDGRLDIPVHIICDDFACSGKIAHFDEYISVFRAAGISVTLLLQSETQLSSMYGDLSAITIINNCDTYVYMGGMDITTCHNIAEKANKPVHRIISMPLEQVIVFRRGCEPVISRRYQTLEDPLYKAIFSEKSIANTDQNNAENDTENVLENVV